MTERTGVITFMGKGLTLVGKPVGVGDAAPAFTALTNELAPAGLADFSEKGLILIAVPSLDTAVCDLEARKFNKEMERLAGKAKAVVVSMLRAITTFIRDEEGASAVEYGLLAALIAAVIVTAVSTLGTTLKGTFETINTKIGGGAAAS